MRMIQVKPATGLAVVLIAAIALYSPLASRAGVQSQPPPTAYTSYASQVTSSSATLQGSVYPSGEQTTYYFQYGATTAYGAQTPLASAGSGKATIHVSAPLSGLSSYTVYHFRLVAIGPGGTVVGVDHSLTTLKVPLTLSLTATPDPVVYGSPIAIGGTLSGTGNADIPLVLQEESYPYRVGFHDIGDPASTSAGGTFSFSLDGLSESAHIRVVSFAGPTVTSPTVPEQVAVKVAVRVKRMSRHGFAKIYGTVSSAVPGTGVAIERLAPNHRYPLVRGTVVVAGTRTTSRFNRTMRVRPGVYRVLVRTVGGRYASADSRPFRIGF